MPFAIDDMSFRVNFPFLEVALPAFALWRPEYAAAGSNAHLFLGY